MLTVLDRFHFSKCVDTFYSDSSEIKNVKMKAWIFTVMSIQDDEEEVRCFAARMLSPFIYAMKKSEVCKETLII